MATPWPSSTCPASTWGPTPRSSAACTTWRSPCRRTGGNTQRTSSMRQASTTPTSTAPRCTSATPTGRASNSSATPSARCTASRSSDHVSGPVAEADTPATAAVDNATTEDGVEVLDSREAQVGALHVRRALPRRAHRTVGAWCFADHMGPASVTADERVDIGPHPHMGLQTVTWLLAGEFLHHDSLGSEQTIKPGQLNLMTAGNGVAHAEEATRQYAGELHGVQLWVAQPEETRHRAPAFEHHAALPKVELDGGEGTVIVGEMTSATSPARRDTDHVGVELALR